MTRRKHLLLLLALMGMLICVSVTYAAPQPQSLFKAYVPIVRKPPVRRETGPGKSLPFKAGEAVVGATIDLNDPVKTRYQVCYLANPLFDGVVTDGVVWPTAEEIAAAPICITDVERRRESGPNNAIQYYAHETVLGSVITDTTTLAVYHNCYIQDPQHDGMVFDGVVWPYADEIARATPCQVVNNTRRESGPGKTIQFSPNEPVIASVIEVSNDTHDRYEGCYLVGGPTGGSITDGVVWPTPEEIAQAVACGNPVNARRETGPGKSLDFRAGEPVIGSVIDVTDGKHYEGCYLAVPGAYGTVTDGVIWPSQAEIDAAKVCQT